MKARTRIVLWAIMSVVCAAAAGACPVCYGAKDTPATAGMDTAIMVLLGITGSVLMGIAAFFAMVWKRTRDRSRLAGGAYVDDRGNLRVNNEQGVVEWNNS